MNKEFFDVIVSYAENPSQENGDVRELEEYLNNDTINFLAEISNLIYFHIRSKAPLADNVLKMSIILIKQAINIIIENNKIEDWQPKKDEEMEWKQKLRELLQTLLKEPSYCGIAADALSRLDRFQMDIKEIPFLPNDICDFIIKLQNDVNSGKSLHEGAFMYLSNSIKNKLITEKSPDFKLIKNITFELVLLPVSQQISFKTKQEQIRMIIENVDFFSSFLENIETSKKLFNCLVPCLSNEEEEVCKLTYDLLEVFAENYYDKLGEILKIIYNESIAQIQQGEQTMQMLALSFWKFVAIKEESLPKIRRKRFILGALNDLLSSINDILSQVAPNREYSLPEEETVEQTCIECLQEFFKLETSTVFQTIADQFLNRNKKDAREQYPIVLQYEAIITKSNDTSISDFFKRSVLEFEEGSKSINESLRFISLRCIAKTYAYYPELFMKQERVSTVLKIISNERCIMSSNDEISTVSLYILSLVLSYAKKEYLASYADNFLKQMTANLLSTDLSKSSDDKKKIVYECFSALAGRLEKADILDLWNSMLINITKNKQERGAEQYKTIIRLASLASPNETLLNKTLDFVLPGVEELDETAFICVAVLQKFFQAATIDKYGDAIFNAIVESYKTHDSNTIESPDVLLGIFSTNYPELFKKRADEIMETLLNCLKDPDMLPNAVCSTILVIYNIENYQESVVRRYNPTILELVLSCTASSRDRKTIEVYQSIFKIVSFIIDRLGREPDKKEVSQIFSLIKDVHKEQLYNDDIGLYILRTIEKLHVNCPKKIGYQIMNESVFWISKKAFISENKDLSELSHTILSIIE